MAAPSLVLTRRGRRDNRQARSVLGRAGMDVPSAGAAGGAPSAAASSTTKDTAERELVAQVSNGGGAAAAEDARERTPPVDDDDLLVAGSDEDDEDDGEAGAAGASVERAEAAAEAGAASANSPGASLPNAPGGQAAGDQEIDDEQLARVLQQQEHAYMLLAQQQAMAMGGGAVGGVPVFDEANEGEDEDAAFARALMRRELEEMAGGTGGLDEAGEAFDEEEGDYEDELEPEEMTYEQLNTLCDTVGTQSKGAGKGLVERLPVGKYAAVAAAAGVVVDGEEQCVVCRCEFEPDEDVMSLPCKHYFCVECITQWLKDQKVCPVCNKEVTAEEGDK
uniref:RING-type domain-containing protein n=1 Tax=Prasinoderma singulare TaxID=676789 RepID=A0A7S3C3Z9_9VIRI